MTAFRRATKALDGADPDASLEPRSESVPVTAPPRKSHVRRLAPAEHARGPPA